MWASVSARLSGSCPRRISTTGTKLDLAELDAPLIGAFLDHLEADRHNSPRTRNARLAALRSFFSFAALRHPEHAALIARVLAIPTKRCDHAEVCYLVQAEADALVAAPDRRTWTGRRDHALSDVALQTGLRASELTGLRNQDVELGTGAHVQCWGKGRKQRCTPLSKQTVGVLRAWMQERQGQPSDPLFPTRRGTPLTRGAMTCLVSKHATTAQPGCPSLRTKRPTPPRPQTFLRDVTIAIRDRYDRDRPMAGTRAGRDDRSDLPARRHVHQRTRPRPHRAGEHQSRALPTLGPVVSLPGQPLIMPPTDTQTRSPGRDPPARQAITRPCA